MTDQSEQIVNHLRSIFPKTEIVNMLIKDGLLTTDYRLTKAGEELAEKLNRFRESP